MDFETLAGNLWANRNSAINHNAAAVGSK